VSSHGGDAEAVVAALERGLVIGIPTDTVYGLAARNDRPAGIARIYELKGRPSDLELPVLVADADQAAAMADGGRLPEVAARLAERHWPGALTVVVAARGGGTVGLRVPAQDLVRALCRQAGPLASTSANRHGDPPLTTAADVRAVFGDGLAVVVDGGVCDRPPSTVVDCTGPEPRVLRPGAVTPVLG